MLKPVTLFLCFFLFSLSISGADYYWVGGSGNWSDISHWATSPGGSTFHNQAPTAEDNVFFDANSFTAPGQTVTINTDNAFCRNMNWNGVTNQPTLTGTESRVLSINGSLQLSPDMTFAFAGDVNFKGTESGLQIDLAGHPLARNTLFSGTGGEWILQSNFAVDSLVQLENGTLITNDQPVTCAYFYILPVQASALQLGNSNITITGNTFFLNFILQPVFFISRAGFTLDPGTSTVELTGTDVDVIVEGDGPPLPFHKGLFSNPMGDTYLQARQPGALNFDSLVLKNGAKLLGAMQFDYLELTPGKGYSFESNVTYTIGELQAPGQCEAPIQILGSSAGEAAIFNSTAGPVNVSYVSLKDIHATGGADFTADNSADLGNNTGWTINSSSMNDLYWVGGSGNWDDPMHWSFTSGGPGGACVPTGADNVFFDANSFTGPGQTVTINLDNALCRNMDWTGATGTPILAGTINENLRIFGSLTFIPAMQMQLQGDVYLQSSTAGNTVATGNHLFTRSVIFDAAGGEWTLLDSLKAIREVLFVKGELRTNDQVMVAHSLRSEQPTNRRLILGNSHIYLRDYNFNDDLYWPTFRIESSNLFFDAGTSTIEYLTYGEHIVSGSSPVDFHKVIFDSYGITSLWDESVVYFDTVIHHESSQYYGGGFSIGSWQLDGGYEYVLSQTREYTIGELVLNNNCNALVYIHSTTNGVQTSIQSDNILTGEYLLLKDLNNIGANDFIANNSTDLGNNQNLTINELTPRTLYWVGDGGPWSDPVHWSLTSGGAGGECIPTPVDNVIFDENSFSGPDQGVWGSNFPQNYCHNITWRDATNNPGFYLGDLLVFGSLEFTENMIAGLGAIRFSGMDAGNTIDTKGLFVNYTNFEGSGSYELLSDYNGFGLNLSGGTWNTNGFSVNLEFFHCFGTETQKNLILEDSHLTINGSQQTIGSAPMYFDATIQIDPGTSLIEFTHPNPTLLMQQHPNQRFDLHNVLFSAEEGTSRVESYNNSRLFINKLQFNNDGIIRSEHTIDSLIFTAGKSYQLEAEKTQTINEYWQIIGNNCLSIELSSTVPGLKSTVTMPAGQVDGDFIQMRDQIATGGAAFYAGTHSTNIGSSNTGWIFDSADDFVEVGFLGEDQVLCRNASIIVTADNRSPNETYIWSDGSTNSSIEISATGAYWAEVSFTDNCTIRDSILVFEPDDFAIDLGEDTAICTGDTLTLDATVDALGITYRWQDDSTEPTYQVTAAGEYKVELELSGCTFRDSIQVSLKPLPVFELGADRTICEGDATTFDGTTMGASYLWNDGSTNATLAATDAGLYWLEVTLNGCSRRDSTTLNTNPSPVVDLGPDQELCDGENLTLDAANAGATYQWQDGSTGATLNATASGLYEVTVDLNGCLRQDQVQLTFKPLPVFDLGPDQAPCEGETVTLDGAVPGATYLWNDGTTNATITVTADGRYRLIATLDGCDYRDSLEVNYKPNPILELGPDQELCDGENLILDATNTGATYQWQDGSASATLNATASGRYEVTVDLNGCTRQDQVQLTFKPLPIFELGPDQAPCEGETVSLDGTVPGATYLWNDGTTNATITVTADGQYRLIATLDGCDYRDSLEVNSKPNPILELGPDQELCDGQNLTLNATNAGATYQWQDGTTGATLNAAASGLYEVTVDLDGCVRQDQVQLTFKPLPVFELGPDQTPCEGETLTLDGAVPGATYRWNDGTTNATISVTTDGRYRLVATLDGCDYRDSVNVEYIVLPKMILGQDQTLCEGETKNLEAAFPGASYQWQDGSSASSFTVSQEGAYWVAVRVGDCEERDSVVFTYNPLPVFDLGTDLLLCEDESRTFTLNPEGDAYRWQDGSTGASLTVRYPGGLVWGEVVQDGCTFRDSVQVNYRQFPLIDLGPDTTICDGEPFSLNVGNTKGQVSWQDGSTSSVYTVTAPGAYAVQVTDGPCVSTDDIIIQTRECIFFDLYMPNAFSPNEDGENDLFQPYIAPGVQILQYSFAIFDRWGNQLFLSKNPDDSWDGSWKGQKVPSGVYIYFVDLEYTDERESGAKTFSGDVTVLR